MILTILSTIIPIVEGVAPLLAKALKSQLGGMALLILAKHFGFNADQLDAFHDKISSDPGDPEMHLKLKECEENNKERLTELSIQAYTIQAQDIQDARKYAERDPKLRMWLIIAVFVLTIPLILGTFLSQDPSVRHSFILLSNIFSGALVQIFVAEFGIFKK